MKKDEAVKELLSSAKENGLISTLYGAFGKSVSVSIPFGKRVCETSIDELDFSVRASNSMKRVGIFTIGEVIDLIADDGLLRVRNLGKKTQNEIKTRILAYCFDHLTEAEKRQFFSDVIEKNCSVG